jgi:hypothetical protein
MGQNDRIYLDDPSQTWALDTTKASLGAPGKSGELRDHMHQTYGPQVYCLRLNESGASIGAGEGTALGVGTAFVGATVTAKTVAATLHDIFGGAAQVLVLDDYWFWSLVEGEGVLRMSTANVAAGVYAYGIANGRFDDGTVGTIKYGMWMEAGSTDNATARAMLFRDAGA